MKFDKSQILKNVGSSCGARLGKTTATTGMPGITSHMTRQDRGPIDGEDGLAGISDDHFYLPGWEIPKMQTAIFTRGYGIVVDYLAEALRELRRRNYTEAIDREFGLGAQLKSLAVKAVRKTVAGLIKLIYPNGELSKENCVSFWNWRWRGRRRVKEQLKKLVSFEFFQTSFSYIDKERDLPCFEFRTTVVVELYGVRCPDCGVKTEKVPQLPSQAPFSKRLEDAVGLACESAAVRRVARQLEPAEIAAGGVPGGG